MKHEVLESLSQESWSSNEVVKSSRIGLAKRQGVSTQGGRIDSSFYSFMPKSEYIIVCYVNLSTLREQIWIPIYPLMWYLII
ncbi:photosystem I P700 chlorophyll a apoprotein A2 [Iris pallida]|uniref:Photosystem I P700 chlorophyll a apoprotein A2 (Plastid) n=1 Tax=Iris pallida TaxID=29817 RepID=A0AAX6F3M7_IRIPA|nr:photosystem I P700 chlorophyll a apoprotein A2 [Iris pallida]